MEPIITSALTAFVTASATKGMNAPMQTLDDLWYLAFGQISQIADMKRARNEINLAQYKNSIAEEILQISEENLQEPPMSIVGPALEASKYYIEEEELRNMFAKVIAAAMDSSKSETVHHSFVEIIKQLSPRDANNFALFKTKDPYPIVRYTFQSFKDGTYALLNPLVFSSELKTGEVNEADIPSISNLNRLGLIDISFETSIVGDGIYDLYKNNNYHKKVENAISLSIDLRELADEANGDIPDSNERELITELGFLTVTPFGNLFMKSCL